jgi:hypothetical protein
MEIVPVDVVVLVVVEVDFASFLHDEKMQRMPNSIIAG